MPQHSVLPATMRLRPRPRLRARAKDRSLGRKLLSLRCGPEQYSTLLWPPVTCNHSCIAQELACYVQCYTQLKQLADPLCSITMVGPTCYTCTVRHIKRKNAPMYIELKPETPRSLLKSIAHFGPHRTSPRERAQVHEPRWVMRDQDDQILGH